jgi:hypothetical protein
MISDFLIFFPTLQAPSDRKSQVVALAKSCVGKQVLDVAVAEMLLPEEALGDLKVGREDEGREGRREDSERKMGIIFCLSGNRQQDWSSLHLLTIPPSLPPARTTTRPRVTR